MRIGNFHFGYNATEDKSRRQSPAVRVRHESDVLTKTKRNKLLATAQDQMRNHALVAWMVRKHLDYVSKFHFSFRTDKPDIDALVNRIFRWHGKPGNLDFMGRFGRDELFRMYEMEKVVSGDAGLIKLDGLKLQAIESDLIAKGAGAPEDVNDSGIVVDEWGRTLQYAICKRHPGAGGRIEFHHMEDADNVIFDAYWTRLSSQFRGVSPLSVALNAVQDLHEAFEFNLIKAKMHALFGVAVMRDASGTDGNFGGGGGALGELSEDVEPTASGSTFDLDPRSINIMDLNPGEKIDILESRTPSGEFVEGSHLFIHIAMLALDIPVTSFDSRRSSFSARIADLNEYEVSADYKRTKNRYVRQDYSDWVIESIWNDTESPWPLRSVAARNGMSMRDVQEEIEWVPSGSPWLDKYKQLQGDQLAIDIALDNGIDAARRKGQNVFENIDKQAKVIAYAREKGVPLLMGRPGSKSIEQIVQEEVSATHENEEADNDQ